MAISTILHEGKEILYADFTACKSSDELLKTAEELMNTVLTSSNNVRVLTNYEGVFVNGEFMDKIKGYGKKAGTKIDKSAVLGINGVKRILLNAYNVAARRNIKAFDGREDALKYLAA